MSDFLAKVYEALTNVKLKDIVIYDFRHHSPYYDYQIIASASNERQANAVINHIKDILPQDANYHIEGQESNRWILIDLSDIIIHVMHQEDRAFYQIEKIFYERDQIKMEETHGV